MTNTQVMSARKFAIAAFSGVVALSLMLPTQLAFADFSVGDDSYPGDANAEGTGSEGGTWAYIAEGTAMTLTDYVGGAIEASGQDLNIQLKGDNKVEYEVTVYGGDLTITGDDSVYGADKPSLTIDKKETDLSGWIYASHDSDGNKGNVTVSDANVVFNTSVGYFGNHGGDMSIVNSKVSGGDANEGLYVYANECSAYPKGVGNLTIKGSVLDVNSVNAMGALTIDNTDLTVTPDKDSQEAIDAGTYDGKWIENAVTGKTIELVGEENGEVKDLTDGSGQYLTTGDDYKVELKASSTPAYYGPEKGMPKTADTTAPFALGAGIAAACSAVACAFALRQRKQEL